MDPAQLGVPTSSNFEFGRIILYSGKSNLVIETRTSFFSLSLTFINNKYCNKTMVLLGFMAYILLINISVCFIRTMKRRQLAQLNGSGADDAMQRRQFRQSKVNWKRPAVDPDRFVICLQLKPIAGVSSFASV